MTRRTGTIDTGYFDKLYEKDQDPWGFETSDYEREKYARTMDALPRAHYARGMEAGCSIGVLSGLLAARCDHLVAFDASALPLARARTLCAAQTNIEFRTLALPHDWPEGVFDLMVFSEVLYYLAPDDLALCAERVAKSLTSSGDIVAVHYTGATDYPLSGDEVATLFGAQISRFARATRSEQRPGYRVDVWRREP